MFRAIVWGCLLMCSTFGWAGNLTNGDLSQVRVRLYEICFRAIRKEAMPLRFRPYGNPDAPATRANIVELLSGVYTTFQKDFKFTTPPVKFEVKTVKTLGSEEQDHQLRELIRAGFVAPTGWLATTSPKEITPKQLGATIGLFLSQLARVTQTPDREYTPYLQTSDD